MATKRRLPAKRSAPAKRRTNSVNGARRRSSRTSRRRRMNAARPKAADVASEGVQMIVGGLLSVVGIGLLGKQMPNVYARAGVSAAVGIGLALASAKSKPVGMGILTGAGIAAGSKALQSTPLAARMNGRRTTPAEYKKIADKLREAGRIASQPGTLGAQPDTLNAAYEAALG